MDSLIGRRRFIQLALVSLGSLFVGPGSKKKRTVIVKQSVIRKII